MTEPSHPEPRSLKPVRGRKLHVLTGPDAGKVFELPASGTVVVGRDKNALVQITDPTVSRTHCRLEIDGDRVLLTNDSQSGTLVNEVPVNQHELRSAEVIRLGTGGETTVLFEVEIEEQPAGKDADPGSTSTGDRSKVDMSRYEVLKELGRGGMGTVHLARDTHSGQLVALKVPFIESDSPEGLARFFREVELVTALAHPNICPISAVGEKDGVPFMATAYIDGATLGEVIAREKRMAQERVVEIAVKLARAMQYAHEHGVIHRDLKPANVMINGQGEPIIMDFGLARRLGEQATLTVAGAVMGTPVYMPFEQASGKTGAVGPHSDQYSLGVICYEMLTGQVPFDGPVAEVLLAIMTKKPRPPHELRPDVNRTLEAVCLKAMSASISDRFPSMADFAHALETSLAVSSTPSKAVVAPSPPRSGTPPKMVAPSPPPGGLHQVPARPEPLARPAAQPHSGERLSVPSPAPQSTPAGQGAAPPRGSPVGGWLLVGLALLGVTLGLFLWFVRLTRAETAQSDTFPLLPVVLLGGGLLAALGGVLFWWRRRTTEEELLDRASRFDDRFEERD